MAESNWPVCEEWEEVRPRHFPGDTPPTSLGQERLPRRRSRRETRHRCLPPLDWMTGRGGTTPTNRHDSDSFYCSHSTPYPQPTRHMSAKQVSSIDPFPRHRKSDWPRFLGSSTRPHLLRRMPHPSVPPLCATPTRIANVLLRRLRRRRCERRDNDRGTRSNPVRVPRCSGGEWEDSSVPIRSRRPPFARMACAIGAGVDDDGFGWDRHLPCFRHPHLHPNPHHSLPRRRPAPTKDAIPSFSFFSTVPPPKS
mmetsp:Transcript_17031/g.35543  ORF Transcript_17031/g.35543 Transcript_17031/m.35543 type:complete len:252 (+) Transcript_17031:792-1547(+)